MENVHPKAIRLQIMLDTIEWLRKALIATISMYEIVYTQKESSYLESYQLGYTSKSEKLGSDASDLPPIMLLVGGAVIFLDFL